MTDNGRQSQEVKCDACGRTVTLRVQPTTTAETMWRWFDCPHCRKANFLRIAGQIVEAVGEQQES